MINKIVSLLKKQKGIEYKVKELKTKTTELFFVRDRLETNRKTNVATYFVTVYKRFDTYMGESSFEVSPMQELDEVEDLIQRAIDRCKYVKNQPFELPEALKTFKDTSKCDLDSLDDDEVAKNVVKAVFKADNSVDGWINSVEIFINRHETRLMNSNGIDYTSHSADLFIEMIPTWVGKNEEIELYQSITTSAINYNDIYNKAKELMANAKARAVAKNLPKKLKKCNVILPQEEIAMIVESFVKQLSYSVSFMNMNLFKVGDQLSDGADCDNMTITLKKAVEGTSDARLFDGDGIVLKNCNIIKDGIIKKLHGDQKYGSYLGVKKPTGAYTNAELEPGSVAYEDMLNEPYIYCVYFSSPQLEEYSSYYGGEVRLGFYFDGKDTYPVTGFSIAGNLYEDLKHFRFSKEVDTFQTFRGPKYLWIPNVNIN